MTHTLFIVSDTPSQWTALTQLSDLSCVFMHTLEGFVEKVVQAQPILIILDDSVLSWATYSQAIKASNATRRIPTLLVSATQQIPLMVYKSGIDYTLTGAEFLQSPRRWIDEMAKIPNAELLEQLACGCQEALPARGIEGIQKFNMGEYYAQHDLFEAQWMAEETPVRDLYRAILQVGVGYYQIERGNYRGALKTLQKSVQWLMLLPDVCQGVDVKQLRDDSFAVRAHLQQLGEARIHEFDKTYLKPVKFAH